MADRTAASAFGAAFAWQEKHRIPGLTAWLWQQSKEYDFAPYQMGADEQLLKLKLISKKDAGREPSSALSFGSASLDGLFKVFKRDGDKERSAELARLSKKKDPLGSGSDSDDNDGRMAQSKDAASDLLSDVGQWVSDHRGITIGLAALAGAIALAPTVASAASSSVPLTPAQLAQAQATQQAQATVDAQRAASQSDALKIAAGAFALAAVATVAYVVMSDEPTKPTFRPMTLVY